MAELTPRYELEQLVNRGGNAVTRVNNLFRFVDAFTGAVVVADDVLAEPGSPAEGDLYLLPTSGTLTGTTWATFTNGNFAWFVNGGWEEIVVDAALEGLVIWVADEDHLQVWTGTVWAESTGSTQTAMSATGTTQGAGTAITARASQFTTVVAASAEAATLPIARAGDHRVVANADAADTLKLFPASGDAINTAATNASVDVPAGQTAILYAVSTAQWYGVIG